MPLIAVHHDGNHVHEYVSGTAFVVGQGYAVTAYHVIEDLIARFASTRAAIETHDLDFDLVTFLSLDKNTRVLPMRVLRVWRAEPLDLALLALEVPSDWPDDYRWKVPSLSLLPPRCGEGVVGFGFANCELIRREGELSIADLHPRSATGRVIEIHHEIRDRARLPFPCFRTNARYDGGMSGGPVISLITGDVCGAICSSLPAITADEEHVSYASTLWPLVGTIIDRDPMRLTGNSERVPVMQLFESKQLYTRDIHRVRLVTDEAGRTQPQAKYPRSEWDEAS